MKPCILVLANPTTTAELAARYAAVLGAPLQAGVALLHLYHDPVLDPDLVTVTAPFAYRNQAETAAAMHTLAQRLLATTEVVVSAQPLPEAVEAAVRRHRPLLLAMGLNPEHDVLDHFLHNQALPALRATHRPLLLVPAAAPVPRVPRRVLLAVDAEPFVPNAAALALAPLLAAWQAEHTVVHITRAGERQAFPVQRALGQVHLSGLLPPATPLELYEAPGLDPTAGLLQALHDTRADLLVLIARPRSFLSRLFHRSVTARVLDQGRGRVPVLLLPAEAPEQPGWMPALS